MYELDLGTEPVFSINPVSGKEFIRVMRSFSKDGKHFGFYVLGTAAGVEPRFAFGQLIFGDKLDEKIVELATFTFIVYPDLSIAFVDPPATTNPIGKQITAREALNHPSFSDVCLIITLAIQHEKVMMQSLRA
jgi:hypothetical protein